MLKVRIIPTLLWKNSGLVKGRSFDSWRRVGSLLPAIKVYNTREVDELIVLDITASDERREPDYEWVQDFSQECFVPLTVGGGVSSVEQIRGLLLAGADKVSINTANFENPSLISDAARIYGSQCIVASIDAKRNAFGQLEVYSHSGTRRTGMEAAAWALELERRGAGEILITSIDHDGLMEGYDLELISNVARAVNIPVIASGGAGSYEDMRQALQCRAAAVAAASMFHFTESTPAEAKKYLSETGYPTRDSNIVLGWNEVINK